ncbi:hypothetical protein Nepgr_023351 [Nepenthes gracilis]|uniref:Pentatricopeptide repeat-containing protein n=1 Tax=Nepenthes gracilis TaxID=150966 RepID=A0AAD3XYY6_NEPGR|nr:hypothetical protein Nepgr_023351 [Nepenthes gracilis]
MERRSEIEHVDVVYSLLRSCNSLFLASCLVDLYASLSFPHSAHVIVSSFSRPNIYLFNRAIRTFSKIPPLCLESLRLYYHMVGSSIKFDNFTYPFLLNSCAALCDLSSGTEIHGRIVKNGFCSCIPVSNALIDMYGECKELGCARIVFDEMRQRDVVSYNALLGAHGRDGKDMLGAQMVFDGTPVRNVISWNALVVGDVNSGDLSSAGEIFDEMPDRNIVTLDNNASWIYEKWASGFG